MLAWSLDGEREWTKYGMPSDHSQFMWFLAVFLLLWLRYRVRLVERFPVPAAVLKAVFGTLWVLLAITVAYSRVYLGVC